jgi:hypothetical protein
MTFEYKPRIKYEDIDSNPSIDVLLNEIDSSLASYIIYFWEDSDQFEGLPEWMKNKPIFTKFLTHTANFIRLHRELVDFRGPVKEVFWNEFFGFESGPSINLEALKDYGLDPNFILVFRRAPIDEKYHRFWTTDYSTVKHGLHQEIPKAKRDKTKILVSTLKEINDNGGLIQDHTDVTHGASFMRITEDVFIEKIYAVLEG